MLCLDTNKLRTRRVLHLLDSEIITIQVALQKMKRRFHQELLEIQHQMCNALQPFQSNNLKVSAWALVSYQTPASRWCSKILTTRCRIADRRKCNSRLQVSRKKIKNRISKNSSSTSSTVNLISDKHTWKDWRDDSSSKREDLQTTELTIYSSSMETRGRLTTQRTTKPKMFTTSISRR